MPREPIAPTRLQARQALSRLPLLISGATAAFSSIGGGALVVWQYGWTMGGLGITFASAAAGVLGAIAGYFASCFVGVAHATWRDAVRESKRQREDPPLETEN